MTPLFRCPRGGQRLPCPGKARQRAPSTLLSASLCGLTGGQWGNVPSLSGLTLWDRNATSGHRVAREPVVLESPCEAALKGGCGGAEPGAGLSAGSVDADRAGEFPGV